MHLSPVESPPGETRHGIKLVAIASKFWGNEATLECDGKTHVLTQNDSVAFPNGVAIKINLVSSFGGYILVDVK